MMLGVGSVFIVTSLGLVRDTKQMNVGGWLVLNFELSC